MCVCVQLVVLSAAGLHVCRSEDNWNSAGQEAGQGLSEEGQEQGRAGGDAGERV